MNRLLECVDFEDEAWRRDVGALLYGVKQDWKLCFRLALVWKVSLKGVMDSSELLRNELAWQFEKTYEFHEMLEREAEKDTKRRRKSMEEEEEEEDGGEVAEVEDQPSMKEQEEEDELFRFD